MCLYNDGRPCHLVDLQSFYHKILNMGAKCGDAVYGLYFANVRFVPFVAELQQTEVSTERSHDSQSQATFRRFHWMFVTMQLSPSL